MNNPDALIIGAGLAGLNCARHLHRRGLSCQLLDAADGVGGRVRTDAVGGFLLDRGFQVLLTAYPETQRALDYEALDLGSFYSGALVHADDRFHRVADPFRHPADIPATLAAPVGSLLDKLRVGWLRWSVRRGRIEDVLSRPEMTTLAALRERWGFSEGMINRFFRPFLGGILLDGDLRASSRMAEFVFRMFSEGQAALPAEGMEAMPRQLAAALPEGALRLNTKVEAIDGDMLTLGSGETLTAPALVVATGAPEADRLLGGVTPTKGRGSTTLYFAVGAPPTDEAILILNGDGRGPANTVTVPSNAQPAYAPPGRALLSVTILGTPRASDEALEAAVRGQLAGWFGAAVHSWTHLRTYRIPYALPDQAPPFLSPPERPVRRRRGLYVCGDHRRTASLNGALAAGRAAASAVAADLGMAEA